MHLLQSMSGANVLITGAAAGIAGSLIMQLREYPKRIYEYIYNRFVFTANIYFDDHFYLMVENWLTVNYPNSYRNVVVKTSSIKEDNKNESFTISNERNQIIIKYKSKFILIKKEREKIEFSNQSNNGYIDFYRFEGWKARKQIVELFHEIIKNNTQIKKEYIKIYKNDNWCWFESNKIKPKNISSIVLDKTVKDTIVNDIAEFVKSKEWYEERGIPYKRTFLFHGNPGNGKTSLSLSLAEKFNKDICLLNLNSISNDSQLSDVFSKIKSNSILLIEDCDKLFSGRKSEEHKVSFSSFINCLDGVLYKNGLITILTTNFIEHLDEALIRDGRVDVKIEIQNPTTDLIKKYVADFYNSNHIQIENCNMPMSKIQEICLINKNDKAKAVQQINQQ